MGPPRYHRCKKAGWRNIVVNAYVRTGGKWWVIGTVCVACYEFWPASTSAGSAGASSRTSSASASA